MAKPAAEIVTTMAVIPGTPPTSGTRKISEEPQLEDEPNTKERLKRASRSYINTALEECIDPVTGNLYIDPVITQRGEILERTHAEKCVEADGNNITLFPAFHLRNIIQSLINSKEVDKQLVKKWKEGISVLDTRKKADAGNTNAMSLLASWYSHGHNGLPQDHTLMYILYKQAAKAGDVPAMGRVGHCLLKGKGVEQNVPEGIKTMIAAAKAGSGNACLNLGCYFYFGKHVGKRNMAMAKHYYQKVVQHDYLYEELSREKVNDAKKILRNAERYLRVQKQSSP